MGDSAPIGIFDSGLGGLTVLREVLNLLPGEDVIYFGDTARTPYGSRPPAEILRFLHEILPFFAAQQVKLAIIACNTMKAIGFEQASTKVPFLLTGVNYGARAALAASRNKRIGVMATAATIASGKHVQAIKAEEPAATVAVQACPRLVPFIEQGKLFGPELESAVTDYLLPLKEAAIDTLILGCTHYPFIIPVIRQVMGPDVVLVDPARETAAEARTTLAHHDKLTTRAQGRVRLCFSSDLPRAEQFVAGTIEFPWAEEISLRFELVNLLDYR
ncbi:Glutamate racemase [uncultured Sporomusa sp.]|uniref:Glutamate racemase n=1 Tax=uncultured Sporomusa sp. TaxID=307249 RepID=A0A212M1V8_9FIRM|nr:glutamate racemase [uncultured Sporomusa sp.]SCM83771.1 Glutamate racemase [uncultured Sporomusa sp.]